MFKPSLNCRFCSHSPENHGTVLPVKGKVVDPDAAGAAVDGRRQPVHAAVRRHQSVAVHCNLKLTIYTVGQRKHEKKDKIQIGLL